MRVLLVLASLILIGVGGVGLADAQQSATVEVGDFFFCDRSSDDACETVVATGETVVWDYSEGSAGHTVTFCGDSCDEPVGSPLFDSGKLLAGETFSFRFDEPGEYLYYCEFHPTAMRGTIFVQPQQTSTPAEPAQTVEPSPVPPTSDAPTPELTATSTSPNAGPETAVLEDGDSQVWLIVPIAIFTALAVLGGSIFALRRRG